jgi:hypothetical protein
MSSLALEEHPGKFDLPDSGSSKGSVAISNIVSQSNKPLKISINFGFFMPLASLIYAVHLVIRYLVWGLPVAGWTSVIVSIYFIGGLIFANLEILGLYIGKVFDETKGRPLYVIRERTWSESPCLSLRVFVLQTRMPRHWTPAIITQINCTTVVYPN